MASCQERINPTAGSEIVYKEPKFVEPKWGEEDYELCPKDQWLRITNKMKSVQLVEKLADAYNVLMVFHSVYSDYECHQRHETNTAKGMKKMKTSEINDNYSRRCADEFRNNMAKSQKDKSIDVDETIDKYLGEMVLQCKSGEICYSTAKTPNKIPQKHRIKYRKNTEYNL